MDSSFSNIEALSIKEAAKQQIKRDIDQAKTHLENHVNTKGQVLDLDKNCEYCHIHFEEQKILKKNDFS
jgi:hypothetical protein